eukprot:TRINITY_DN7073_c0_g1_i2.p1 TRINITY_DN7073_c0_g1~~TRINITY_DN7073_c0_g1_i2.p1  ORF type:complete len:324 (+),score=31.54 TRINITY_DN7073_c0_g1_i2:153-1124(+)
MVVYPEPDTPYQLAYVDNDQSKFIADSALAKMFLEADIHKDKQPSKIKRVKEGNNSAVRIDFDTLEKAIYWKLKGINGKIQFQLSDRLFEARKSIKPKGRNSQNKTLVPYQSKWNEPLSQQASYIKRFNEMEEKVTQLANDNQKNKQAIALTWTQASVRLNETMLLTETVFEKERQKSEFISRLSQLENLKQSEILSGKQPRPEQRDQRVHASKTSRSPRIRIHNQKDPARHLTGRPHRGVQYPQNPMTITQPQRPHFWTNPLYAHITQRPKPKQTQRKTSSPLFFKIPLLLIIYIWLFKLDNLKFRRSHNSPQNPKYHTATP